MYLATQKEYYKTMESVSDQMAALKATQETLAQCQAENENLIGVLKELSKMDIGDAAMGVMEKGWL